MRLQGNVALLTGAAAAIKGELMGFGGAAHLFVHEGAKVVLTDIRDDLGEPAAAPLRAEGHDARYLHLDVTSEQNWAQVADAMMAAHGPRDILFNNAGVSFPGNVKNITVGTLKRELGVHAKRSRRSSPLTASESCMKSALSNRSGPAGHQDQGHRAFLRYLRSFASILSFGPTDKKVITQRAANNANS